MPWPWEEWQGRGIASVNQTRPHYVNQMGKTHSKPLAARHGMGAACYVWIGLKLYPQFSSRPCPVTRESNPHAHTLFMWDTKCHPPIYVQVYQMVNSFHVFWLFFMDLSSPPACCMSRHVTFPLFYRLDNIYVTKFLIMQLPYWSCYFCNIYAAFSCVYTYLKSSVYIFFYNRF